MWDRLGKELKKLRTERDAALAKAEAAEKAAQFWEDAHRLSDGHLTDLRARIEALADNWDKWGLERGTSHSSALRALLRPAKPETALDVLSRVEERYGRGDWSGTKSDMAKLRKLLEAASPQS